MTHKKISIITPNYNGGQYLEETIKSILNQDYPNLEYLIIDGGSTDNSLEIIKKYANHFTYWISEPDNGMYCALKKGFEKSTGEIMGWTNSDDMLHPKSLFTINELFHLKGIKWIQGLPTTFDEAGRVVEVVKHRPWSKFHYFMGQYKWIQQESTFWHRSLWEKAGGYINSNIKYAGDFELWSRFFEYEKLFTPNCLIGGFRLRRRNQLSLDYIDDYHKEVNLIINKFTHNAPTLKTIKKIEILENLKAFLQKTKILNHIGLCNRIDIQIRNLHDFPPSIFFDRTDQMLKISNS